VARPFLTVVEPPAPVGGDLPRMDVAGFAGFAEAGPFGVPVCVESPAAFAAVFGRPVALPGGPGRLAGAVGAFFAQGGRRVWVARCAGAARPAAARFPLPGVMAVGSGEPDGADDKLTPATLAARSAGTFADDMRMTADVRRNRILVVPEDLARVRVTAADVAVPAGALAELPLLRADAPARRYGVLQPTGAAGSFHVVSLLTVAEAPALAAGDELAGRVGERAARIAREPGGRARVRIELGSASAGASAPALGQLVRFRPDPVRPALPARAPIAPEPDTWLLVSDVSASRAGAGPPAVDVSGPAVHVDRDPAGTLVAGAGAVLSLDLAGRELGDGARWRLSGLGCTPSAPGWPGRLAGDEERYLAATGPAEPPATPICGAGLSGVRALVPILPDAFGVEAAPLTSGAPAARNGIAAGPLEALLGGHAGLAAMPVPGLASMIVARDRTAAAAVGGLPGIAALLDAPEPTLLAVPDAVVAAAAPGAPAPPAPSPRLPALAPDTAAAGFGACGALPATPAPADPQMHDGGVTLSWVGDAGVYEIGLFTEPSATAPAEILYRGPAEVTASGTDAAGHSAPVFGITLAPGARGWARIRAIDASGRAGGWSIGVALPLPAAGTVAVATGDAEPGDLRTVHRVLLRLAALRGDTLALLSVPPAWRAAQARAHVAALQAELGASERHVLAFGTLAHPWPRVPAPAPELVRPVAPDGTLAGQLAAIAATRGAWIAVSDRPLRDAVDTTDTAGDAGATGPANRYVTGVRGVSADGQDTLALDEDDRPVNVRRLLALLRRAALERAQRTVFEPNGPALWRALHRDMDGLLALMHHRGAFRPERAVEAYRVDVFPGDARAEDGRCICEMRVAPSLPMRFLTVRLERHEDGGLTAVAS